jgi:Polysaccharide biosynthesis enzyme WcbI
MRRSEALARGGKPRRPICLVYGNCQAEPVRALLASSAEFADAYEAVRLPAVHEVSASQVPRFQRMFRAASLIVTQQVKDGYRGLPLGTGELIGLAPNDCRVIRFPALYYDALYPLQVYVHVDGPPPVPAPMTVYHDLRTLCTAANGLCAEAAVRWVSEYGPPETALHAAAERAAAMVRHYESGADIRVLDTIIARPQAHARSFFTVSHPARFVMQRIADGVQDILGLTPSSDVHANREPLGLFRTPLEQSVIDALGLAAEPASDWIIKGKRVSTADLVRLHVDWYRQRPDVVRAGLNEHADRIAAFGLLR